jgi:hypothetical protein
MNLLNFILLFAPAFPPYIPPNPGAPGGGPLQPCWPPPCVPITDHIWVLVVIAIIYVYYKTNLKPKLK